MQQEYIIISQYSIVNNHLAFAPLHLSRILYKSPLFMQNKPNLLDAQMNVYPYITTDYENISDWTLGENKPNSKPIKPNFRKAKMNVNSLITKDYRKNDDFVVRINKPNSNPISSKAKMSANSLLAKDYEKDTALRPKKNKPNSNPILVDSCWTLSRTEFTPHFDAGMRGRNDNAGG